MVLVVVMMVAAKREARHFVFPLRVCHRGEAPFISVIIEEIINLIDAPVLRMRQRETTHIEQVRDLHRQTQLQRIRNASNRWICKGERFCASRKRCEFACVIRTGQCHANLNLCVVADLQKSRARYLVSN